MLFLVVRRMDAPRNTLRSLGKPNLMTHAPAALLSLILPVLGLSVGLVHAALYHCPAGVEEERATRVFYRAAWALLFSLSGLLAVVAAVARREPQPAWLLLAAIVNAVMPMVVLCQFASLLLHNIRAPRHRADEG